MANLVEAIIYGIDVSLKTLDIAQSEQGVKRIPNTERAIAYWLKNLPAPARIAIEATGSYHETLLKLALESGLEVYVINGKQLHHYREAAGQRAKTDPRDAQLIRRYLSYEYRQLTPAKPLNDQEKRLWRLLKRRALLVKVRTQVCLSMKGDLEVEQLSKSVVAEIDKAIRKLEEQMRAIVKAQGWESELAYCRSVPGIGPIKALARKLARIAYALIKKGTVFSPDYKQKACVTT
jgi:transposase